MKSRTWGGYAGAIVMAVACAMWPRPVAAQQVQQGAGQAAPNAPRVGEVESDPMKCWWKTDKTAVHVAEPFTVLLTCGVVETSRVKVVADTNRLDPMAIALTPFDVVSGVRHGDIEAPPWRYFQYSYTVRLLGSEFIGRETTIPSIQLTYRIESATGDGTQGRDQLYIMPALPLRVLSLAPTSATDILDSSPETFADIDARLFRATTEVTAGGVLVAFAVVLAGLAFVRMGRGDARVSTADRLLSTGAVLRGCVQEMEQLKTVVARDGWTPELTGRALAMCRVAGAIALDGPLGQTAAATDAPEREGQVALSTGQWRPKRVLVSAPTTPAVVTAGLANGRAVDAGTQTALEEIRSALGIFGAARYGRGSQVDAAGLDAALDDGVRAIGRLHVKTRDAADAFASGVARVKGIVWSR